MDVDMNIAMEVEESPAQGSSTASAYSTEPYSVSMENDEDTDEPATSLLSPKPFDVRRSFREELDFHERNPVWGFRYGKEAAAKTKENVVRQEEFVDIQGIQPRQSTSKQNPVANVPLPIVSWGSHKEIWAIMMKNDEAVASRRNTCALFENPRMLVLRAVLLDWLMEICNTCRFRRVTFYLAVDYIDRYLTVKSAVPRSYIQLLGITSLFIAAKMEEKHKPKVSELSLLCEGRDDSCSVENILNCEKVLLNTLGWEVNVMTPPEWLNLFMQICQGVNYTSHGIADYGFHMFPQYSGHNYINAMNLIDLMVLDPGFIYFKYSVIAASALYLCHGAFVAERATGLDWEDVKYCVDYMNAYYVTIKKSDDPEHNIATPCSRCNYCRCVVESFRLLNCDIQLIMSETFSLQTYVNSLDHFEIAIFLRLEQMGYYAIETNSMEAAAKYTRSYEIGKISKSHSDDEGRRRDVFCHSADLFTPGIKINFLEIVQRITECARRTLSLQENK